jgi:hypothetical protein
MASDETTHYVEATAATLKLEIRDEWKPNVIRFFQIAEKMADDVLSSGAAIQSEAAPVVSPRGDE